MKRLVCVAGVLAVLGAATLSTVLAGADDTPSIKQVMVKLHKGADAPIAVLKTQLKSDTPDWAKVQKATKDFVILGASLAKNDPPKGDAASWKPLANAYFADSKATDDAASAKDLNAARASFGKLAASCKSCHVAHKGK